MKNIGYRYLGILITAASFGMWMDNFWAGMTAAWVLEFVNTIWEVKP